jgi:hypothetical protein
MVYLGGLGGGRNLSSHLASRQEVGDILRSSGVPTIEFRASIVIGSGSASYEVVRALVETLPVIVTPRWVDTAAQPIAIEDVVDYLVAAHDYEGSGVFEIGGEDRVTYGEIVREYAYQRELRRRLVRLPVLTPRASRFFLGLLTPVYGQVAGAMVDSLRNQTVVENDAATRAFVVRPRGLKEAVARALVNEDREFAETRWSDALPTQEPLGWSGISFGRRQVSSRAISISRAPEHAFEPIERIGGRTGWYGADWFWKLRGVLDTLRGGVGLRRGRRDPLDLRVGDTVDFWRVERFESHPHRLLRLAAEMKIPGRLWLQFEVEPNGDGTAQIRQTTVFDPAGYVGLGYWYLLCPIHELVFAGMFRGIVRAARPTARGSAARAGGLGDRRRCGPPLVEAGAASAGDRNAGGARAQHDQQQPGDELVQPGGMIAGVTQDPRADREPDAAEERHDGRSSQVRDQQRERPEGEHQGHVVGDRRVAVGKPPDPRRGRDPENHSAGGERAAVVDVGYRESFHSMTSSSGRAKTAKSSDMAGSTRSRTTPPAIAIAPRAACVAAAL